METPPTQPGVEATQTSPWRQSAPTSRLLTAFQTELLLPIVGLLLPVSVGTKSRELNIYRRLFTWRGALSPVWSSEARHRPNKPDQNHHVFYTSQAAESGINIFKYFLFGHFRH